MIDPRFEDDLAAALGPDTDTPADRHAARREAQRRARVRAEYFRALRLVALGQATREDAEEVIRAERARDRWTL